jgi:hypothetical protein
LKVFIFETLRLRDFEANPAFTPPTSEQTVRKQFNYICLKDSKAQRRAFYSPVGVSGDLPGLRRINFWHFEIQTLKNYFEIVCHSRMLLAGIHSSTIYRKLKSGSSIKNNSTISASKTQRLKDSKPQRLKGSKKSILKVFIFETLRL